MELWGDCAGIEVEDEWDRGSVVWTEAHKHVSVGSWLPAGELLTILQCLLENIGGATPDMVVLKLGVWPSSVCENVMGTEACGWIRHVVKERDCVVHCEGPKFGIGDFWPVYCSVEHTGTCNCHDGAYAAFSNAVVVMCPNSSEAANLSELF